MGSPDGAPSNLIPQADPGAAFHADAHEIEAAVLRVLRSGRYVLGEEVAGLEAEYAAWSGATAAIGCGSGTDALVLALQACSIGAGMAVATVSHTAVATVAAIELSGAVPVLLDIDPLSYTMDPGELATLLSHPPPGLPPIRAVVPVHLYGQPADMPTIAGLCRDHGVALIEDCSQAVGATSGGRHVGTFGQAAAVSFYPTKTLAALGDAGMVLASDAALAERLVRLRQYGWTADRTSLEPGRNSRLDEIQAAVLRVRLPKLDAANARRRTIAAAYDAALEPTAWRPPARSPGCTHVFHQYVVRVPGRAAFRARLQALGIGTAVHYAPAIHQQPAYAGRIPRGPGLCRQTELAAAQIVSLPIYPELSDLDVQAVCSALRKA